MQFYDLTNFTFTDGTILPAARLAYQIFNPHGSRTALIPTCFRGRISTTCNFSTGALRNHQVIVVALFGNGESSSPSNTADFPKTISYLDCVRAQHALITTHLKLDHLDVILGFSMGGQCTYHWAAIYPAIVCNAVMICSSAKTSLHNIQFLEGPKAALLASGDYTEGRFRVDGDLPIRGLHAFGTAYSAWLTSAEWFEQELFRVLGYESLEAWAGQTARRNYEDWHPDDLLAMLGMWQRGDVCDAMGGSLEGALGRISSRVLLMPCLTDQYFKSEVSGREAGQLRDAQVAVIPSVWGHLAGSGASKEDSEWMDARIDEFLGSL